MSMEVHRDSATHHEIVTRKRNVIVQRLMRALDALDRKRHMVTEVVDDVASFLPGHKADSLPSAARPASLSEGARTALVGAVTGGAVLALGLYLDHRRRERQRPLRLLQRAWFKYAMPPQASAITRLVTEAVGSLVLSVAREAARAGVQRLLDARAPEEGPEILERLSDAPDPNFVTEPVTVDPGVMHPREAAVAPSGIAAPEPITPLPSPLREFT